MNTIELDADKSMLLLLTKGHRHKDVFMNRTESRIEYIQRCCNFRCFGSDSEFTANVWGIYASS